MKVREDPDGKLVVSHDSTGMTRFFLVLAVVFLAILAYNRVTYPRDTGRLVGSLAAVGICFAVGLLMLERGRFTIDPNIGMITWRRRWAWWGREGRIPFDQVEAVLVQTPIGDEGIPSRRICLRLAGDRELPMSAGFAPDVDDTVPGLAGRIRKVLGHRHDPLASIRGLIEVGRTTEAIRVLRQQEGLTLEEAKRQVDALQSQRP